MSTDNTNALLPCPFCGHAEPSFERMGTPRQSCIVVCGSCGCRHESSDEGADCGKSWNARAALAQRQQAPERRSDGMPASAGERYLRRLLAVRSGIFGAYFDDGEAQGQEHGIVIDFMREPVADIDAKLRALNVARAAFSQHQQAPDEPTLDRESTWWALAMGAAASLEDAANCMRDPDAEKAALGAAAHVRRQCAALTAAPSAQAEPQEPVGHLHSNGDFCQLREIQSDWWPILLYATSISKKEGSA